MKKHILLFTLLISSILCLSDSLTIYIPSDHFKIDESRLLIVSHIGDFDLYNDLSSFDEIIISLNHREFTFEIVPNNVNYSSSYSLIDQSSQYTLYFTQLPIVSIVSQNPIVDEPKTPAYFSYSDLEQVFNSTIGIEIRGGYSQFFPKKTYDLEFWQDETGNTSHDVQFGSMRNDDDWILDALYNEPLRLRSYVANKLWLDMHSPYYRDEEPEAKSGADIMYVELFLNGRYNGVYNLSEQIDKKQLKLKSYNGDIRGELYKGTSWGASTFSSLPHFNNHNREWSGYEMKYPKEGDITNWENIYNFTNFVMHIPDSDFRRIIWEKFNYDNYLDYFIFLNLLRATDNTGKNIYLAKYNSNEPYYYIPWDLDGCFGMIWDGTEENITNDILANGFQNRVIELNPQNYSDLIANRWFDYRDNILEKNNLIEMFEYRYNFLSENKLYERESLVYPNYQFNQQDLSYLTSWIQERLSYLDIYFNEILSIDESKEYLYPNPTNGKVYLNNFDEILGTEFKIYDVLGNLINVEIIYDNYISTEKLAAGIYILVLNNKPYRLVVK